MTKPFDRILIVMFENQYRSYVIEHPFMRKLALAGAELTNSFGAFHPSQTNYVASLAGEVCALTNDTPPASPLLQQTLVDLLEDAGVTWKAYMEGYPGDPFREAWKSPDYPPNEQPIAEFPVKPSALLARYFRKHNAFASFHGIQKDKRRWEKIVGESEFWKDVADKGVALPEYGWFTPDIWNDGHYLYNTHVDTDPRTLLISQMAGWLEYVFFGNIPAADVQGGSESGQPNLGLNLDIDRLLIDPAAAWAQSRVPERTLIVITFDEADFDAIGFDTNYDGPNQVYTVLLGDMIEPGTVCQTPVNHYGVINTVERNFDLGSLGKNDEGANWLRFLWGEKFAWSAVTVTDVVARGELAATHMNGKSYVVFDEGTGQILASELCEGASPQPVSTGLSTSGTIALAALDGMLHVVGADDSGQLWHARATTCGSWSEAQPLGVGTSGSIAMVAYHDVADGVDTLRLCFVPENAFIHYLVYCNGEWASSASAVGQLTDGPMALAQLGPSLFLVYKERNTRKMRMTSFNLAPFNAFMAQAFNGTASPQNDTSLHRWSPADIHVGHFSKKMNALQNNYQAMGNIAMATIEGEMHLINRGGYLDTPQVYTAIFGLTGILTAASQETNGFGTIEEAGWTLETQLHGMRLAPEGGISIASDGSKLTVVWQDQKVNKLAFRYGTYSSS